MHEWRCTQFHIAILNVWTHRKIWTVRYTSTQAHTHRPEFRVPERGLCSPLTHELHLAHRLQDDIGVPNAQQTQGPGFLGTRQPHESDDFQQKSYKKKISMNKEPQDVVAITAVVVDGPPLKWNPKG